MKKMYGDIKFFAPFFKHQFYLYIIILLLIFISTGAVYIYPYLYSEILAQIHNSDLDSIVKIFLFMIVSSIVLYIMDYFRHKLYLIQNNRVIIKVKCHVFEKLFDSNHIIFQKFSDTDILNRLERDLSDIVNSITEIFFSIITYIFSLVSLAIIMFILFPELAVIVLLLSLIMVGITKWYGKVIYGKQIILLKRVDNNALFLLESLRGVIDIVSLGLKKKRFNTFHTINEQLANEKIELSMNYIVSSKLVSLLGLIANILVYTLGGYIIIVQGKYNAELIVAAAGYTQLFIGDVTSAVNLNIDFGVLRASIDRVKELFNFTELIKPETAEKNRIDRIETITFSDVTFGYEEGEEILSGLTLHISKGEKLAITGENGSGKSTFTKLLLGFLSANSGKVIINGVPIEHIDADSYYSKLSVVSQNPVLFSGTVMENIEYGEFKKPIFKKLITLLNIENDFLYKPVGFMGDELSAGEKQKVAIMRSLLGDFDMYILDEFNNHIDTDSYNNVLRYIQSEMQDKTIICITHDKSNLHFYDRIIHIENGMVEA